MQTSRQCQCRSRTRRAFGPTSAMSAGEPATSGSVLRVEETGADRTRGGRPMYAKHVVAGSLLFLLAIGGCHRGGFASAPAGTQGAGGPGVSKQNIYATGPYLLGEGLPPPSRGRGGEPSAHPPLGPP